MKKDSMSWKISDIQRLIDGREKENAYLEYKRCAALTNDEVSKIKLSKDISAFANAGGGTIIYGVIEKNHLPKKIDVGFDPKKITREWLESVINSRIKRKIEGIIINQIELDNGKVIYTVNIPQSKNAPHQAADHKFYTRKNFMALPMEEYEIRDVFMRKKAPNVTLDLFFRRHRAKINKFPLSVVNPETMHTIEINGTLKNEGGGEVHYSAISLIIDKRLAPDTNQKNIEFRPLKLKIGKEEIEIFKIDINWGGPTKMPLFRTVKYQLLNEDMNIHFKVPWLKERNSPFIWWEIRAPNMELNVNLFRLKLDRNNNAYWKPGKLISFSKMLQDGRNREFLETPDLSINPEIME